MGKSAKWFCIINLTFFGLSYSLLQTGQQLKIGANRARIFSPLALWEHLENFESCDLLIFMNFRFQ